MADVMGERQQPSDERLQRTYEAALVQGRKLFHDLRNSILRPCTDRLLCDCYEIETGYLRTESAIAGEISKWNLNASGQTFVEVYSPGREEYDAAYSFHVSGRGGLLLVNEIHKSRDVNIGDRQLRPTEIGWQAYLIGAARDGASPLRMRCLAMYHVVNENTTDVIFESVRRSTSTLEKENGHMEFTETDDGFYALLGSVLGKYAMNLLLDHQADIGYRCVDRIVLFGRPQLVTGREWGYARSFMILLSEPRLRTRARTEIDPPEPTRKRRRFSNPT